MSEQIVFIHGGGEGTHDAWDDKLVDSLTRELGDDFEIRYPRMPGEGDPSYARWGPAIQQAIGALNDGATVVGHSVGGTLHVRALAEHAPDVELGAIVLLAVPFVGDGGWPGDDFEMPRHLGDRLPDGVPVHVFHGLDDDTAQVVHADLYGCVIPQAQVHRLPGRDHQLGNDLAEVARVIRALWAPE